MKKNTEEWEAKIRTHDAKSLTISADHLTDSRLFLSKIGLKMKICTFHSSTAIWKTSYEKIVLGRKDTSQLS